jgi:hypothetical protein
MTNPEPEPAGGVDTTEHDHAMLMYYGIAEALDEPGEPPATT